MLKIITALFAAMLIVVCFSVYPQYRLRQIRGAEFQGVYATYDLDETAYAAYLQALIDERPRRNDPYTGRDDLPNEPQPESIFSIQFVTAYPVALAARAAGVTASDTMPAISAVSAILTALAIFYLIYLFCGNALRSLAGTVTVVAGGALISWIGVVNTFYEGGVAYPYLPLFRRHIPSLSFPFMFGFVAFIYSALRARGRSRIAYAGLAAACFAVLVYSYFYLWTATLAIVGLTALILMLWKAKERGNDLVLIWSVGAALAVVLIPYIYLLSHRNTTADAAQLLVLTHRPDLWRNIEIIGVVAAAISLACGLWKLGPFDRLRSSMIASFGLTAAVVFNQQVVTGRSLQPFHYEYYSVNYVVLLAVVLTVIGIVQHIFASRLYLRTGFAVILLIAATGWGSLETIRTAALWDDLNIERDQAVQVNQAMRKIGLGSAIDPRSLVSLNLDSLQGDSQPTISRISVLWARHQHAFAGLVSNEESKLRYYQYLYYQGLDGKWLHHALTGCTDIEACMMLFGWDRFNPTLSSNARPVTRPEIDAEAAKFEKFALSFGPNEAFSPTLSFLVARKGAPIHENLEKWYEAGNGEDHGDFTIYRLTPRPR